MEVLTRKLEIQDGVPTFDLRVVQRRDKNHSKAPPKTNRMVLVPSLGANWIKNYDQFSRRWRGPRGPARGPNFDRGSWVG